MNCDIIIPIWNQLEFTKTCIEKVLENTDKPYKLILIDNASDPETKDYICSLKDGKRAEIEIIRNEENVGFVKAVNQGIEISEAPYICILNNDTIPAPGWLKYMIDFAEDHPDAGLINPQCDGHLNTPIEEYAGTLEKNKGEYMEMNQCQGFCMLVKREVVKRIGYLDENFGIGGYDDTDYSMRAHLAGYRSVAIKNAYVYHRLHGSFNKSGDREKWVARNSKLYYEKWGRHLRIGIAVSLNGYDERIVSRIVELAYGLAREWSWVHIWFNVKADKESMRRGIGEVLRRNRLPSHQNIRIEYSDMPILFFGFKVGSKVLERMRKRMRDKRFDAVLTFGRGVERIILPFAKLARTRYLELSLGEGTIDWQKKGKEMALSIKEEDKGNEPALM